jgi:hypothetical protein
LAAEDGVAAIDGAGEAAAVVVVGAGATLSLQAGDVAKTKQTHSFFGAIIRIPPHAWPGVEVLRTQRQRALYRGSSGPE